MDQHHYLLILNFIVIDPKPPKAFSETYEPLIKTSEECLSKGSTISALVIIYASIDGFSDLTNQTNNSGKIVFMNWVKNCMLTSYYHRDDLQPFDVEGWYRTGDKGYVANGEIYIVGRSKDLIINAGKNIYPQDIEAIVNSVAGVHPGRAVVFGVEDEREGTELIAVVAEVDTDEAAIRKQISQSIRQHVGRQSDITLNFVTLVDKGWLIKTSSGKIARGKNRDKWMEERQSQS